MCRRFDVSQRVLEQFFCVAESLGLQHMIRLEDTPVGSRTSLLEMPCSPTRQRSPSPRPTAQLASCSLTSLHNEETANFLCSEGTPMSPRSSPSTTVSSTENHQKAACSSTSSSSPVTLQTVSSPATGRQAATPAPRRKATTPAPPQKAVTPAPPRRTAGSGSAESVQPKESAENLDLQSRGSVRAQRKCPHCLQQFPVYNYTRHLRTHADQASKKCDLCGKVVERGDNMKRHKESHCPRY